MAALPHEISPFKTVSLPANETVFMQGDGCHNYIVVTSGCVRVFARSSEGRELILYRINPGEICVLTTSCLMGKTHYPAEARTETEVTAKIIPHADFNRLIEESTAFRQFIFNSFSHRLTDLMLQLEQVGLESIEARLKRFLLSHADEQHRLQITHQEIAVEIGSAREVVSRHLKTLEKQNIIRLSRGVIELVAPEKLQERSCSEKQH